MAPEPNWLIGPDYTSVLPLVSIVGSIGAHKGVYSWPLMSKTLLNGVSMIGGLAAESDSLQIRHIQGSLLD